MGALGEMAFCKSTGRFWSGSVNTFKEPDAGERIQVRTRADHDHEMIVREKDKDDDVFVLVTGGPAEFLVRGWLYGSECKDKSNWKNPGGYGSAFFVSAEKLRPMHELPHNS